MTAVVRVPVPGAPAYSTLCEYGTELHVGFFLEHEAFPDETDPGNPDIIGNGILFVGNGYVRVYDAGSSGSAYNGTLFYQVTLPLDSFRTQKDPGSVTTVEVILNAIESCDFGQAVGMLHCVLRRDKPVTPANYGGNGIPMASWMTSPIRLPTIGAVVEANAPYGKFGRSTLLPFANDSMHAIHAALLKDGRIISFRGSGPGYSVSTFYTDTTGVRIRFPNPSVGNPDQVPSVRGIHTTLEVGGAVIYDPVNDAVSEVGLPRFPSEWVDTYDPYLNLNFAVLETDDQDHVLLKDVKDETIEFAVDGFDAELRTVATGAGIPRLAPIIRRYPNFFCSGHCLLPDGKLLVVGGTYIGNYGRVGTQHGQHQRAINIAALFDPDTCSWMVLTPGMKHGRWYPTCLVMGNGSTLVMGGHTDDLDQTDYEFTESEKQNIRSESRHIVPGKKFTIDMVTKRRHENTDLEIFIPDVNGWVLRPDAQASYGPYNYIERYPQLFALPGGMVFSATPIRTVPDVPGSRRKLFGGTGVWNPATGVWSKLNGTLMEQSTSAMLPLLPVKNYEPTILATGAGAEKSPPPVGTNETTRSIAYFIQPENTDENGEAPWVEKLIPWLVTTPGYRDHGYAVLLADGSLALVGGHNSPFRKDEDGVEYRDPDSDDYPRLEVQVYDPFVDDEFRPLDGVWSTGARIWIPRNYHAVALLIPDGRVWITGGHPHGDTDVYGYEEMDLYSPDYLSRGPRPAYGLATEHISYDQEFAIYLRSGWMVRDIDVERVALVRCSSATHGMCVNQRYVGLRLLNDPESDLDTTEMRVLAPPNGDVAPPGYYMLFVLSRKTGTPSVAQIIQVG